MESFKISSVLLLILISQVPEETSGKLVQYTLVVSYMSGYPDGILSHNILAVNNSFPGPTLTASVGDVLEITLINSIQDRQNVTLHWHGLHQKHTIFEDGVSMITQCPLAYGHSQVYRFNATQPGTYWYHSHFRSQYTEGLFGPLIIHEGEGQPPVFDYYGEATLILSDWYHRPAKETEEWYTSQQAFGQVPLIDSVLVNGMGKYNCPAALLQNLTCRSRRMQRPVVRIQRGQVYRIRLINSAARTPFDFSIAEHDLKVIEADGVDALEPVLTHVIPISEGQRYSFLVKCNENSTSGGRYLIRSYAETNHANLRGVGIININQWAEVVNPNATAILECTDEDLSSHPGKSETVAEHAGWIGSFPRKATISTPHGPLRFNQMDLKPFHKTPAPDPVDEEHTVSLTFLEDYDDDVRRPSINYVPFTYPDDKPLLQKIILEEEITNQMTRVNIKEGSVVQVVVNNLFANPHPVHLHGHHFWVLGVGKVADMQFNSTRDKLTLEGMQRDTIEVPSMSWVVIRFVADNPGVWLMHCHLDWHAVSGMAMVFVEGEETLRERLKERSEETLTLCRGYNETGEGIAILK